MPKFLVFLFLLTCTTTPFIQAQGPQEEQTKQDISPLLSAITSGEPSKEQWAEAITHLANPEFRPRIEKAISGRKTYPRKELVALLEHPQLAVRIGALETLEDASGDSFNFSPWDEPSTTDENRTAISLWNDWAGQDSKISEKSAQLSPEQLRTYIQNVLSGDRSRAARAIRMMESDNFNAVSAIQQFLVANPDLPPVKIALLKQAQYELVLIKSSRPTAAILAKDLVIGNRDQQLAALSKIKKLGLITIPIIRDFIDSPDALVRETAIDAILTVGGRQVLPFIAQRLQKESDVNVIHIAIRKIKNIPSPESSKIIEAFLDHKDEDIIVAATEGITKLKGGSSDNSFSFNRTTSKKVELDSADEKIIALLKDPRWRVRVAAVSHIADCKLTSANNVILSILENDDDEFVRANAIEAAVALKIKDSLPIFRKLFLAHDELIGAITPAYISLNKSIPDDLFAHLKTRNPDTIISALKAFRGSDKDKLKVLSSFATHKDLDVACVALRLLANDDDKLQHSFVANVLTDALKSGSNEKIEAIISTLDLPSSKSIDPKLLQLLDQAGLTEEKTTLDPLYDAFLRPGGKIPTRNNSIKTDSSGGLATFTKTLASIGKSTSDNNRSFQIALALIKSGNPSGVELLRQSVNKMPVSKRASLAEALYDSRHSSVIPLFQTLLQDDSPEIRKKAAQNAFSEENNKVLVKLAIDNLIVENTKLLPHEVYSSYLESVARNSTSKRTLQAWCRTQLNNPESGNELRTLCLILIRHNLRPSDESLIIPATKSDNQWVRRAAWYCLGQNDTKWFQDNIQTLRNDKSANVRAVLPESYATTRSVWKHRFNDIVELDDNSYSSTRSKRRLNKNAEQYLTEIAEKDPNQTNRFEALFTLLQHSRSIPLNSFISLISKQPKEARATYRLSEHVEANYKKMGKGLRPLLAYIDFKYVSDSKIPLITKHFKSDVEEKSTTFNTFADLEKNAKTEDAPQHLATPEQLDKSSAKRDSLVVIFFEKDGCAQCAKAIKVAEQLKADFPLLTIKRLSITSEEGILLNAHLSRKLNLPASADGKVPSFFTSVGYVVPPITPQSLGSLLEETMSSPVEKDWHLLEAQAPESIQLAKEHVDKKFDNLTLPIVIAGGLLDGINPCAFATIIFFLSYLTVAKRSPKEIFFVGVAFILAIFLSYLSVGLLFSSFIKTLTENSSYLWLKNALNYIFAGFALLVAFLSFRDYLKARKGSLDDMTLQLPNFLKKRIKGVIRKGAKSRNFIIAAFLSGIAISFLELACTGQVYAPIIYKINQGSADAVSMLVIYNLAFILPLVVIFALAMGGIKSTSLIDFQQKHTATIKLLTAILFLLLATVLIFSDKIGGLIKSLQPAVATFF